MMSKIKLITIIFLIALFGCQNTKQMPVAIELENLQVLYEKLENPITYVYKGLNCKDLLLVCDTTKAKIVKSKYQNCEFSIRPFEAWKEGLDIQIYKKSIDPINLLETKNFKILKLTYTASLIGKERGSISKKALTVARNVDVRLDNFVFEGIRYRAKSYDYMLVDYSGKKVIDKGHVEGNRLPTRMKEILYKLEERDVIHIYNIETYAPIFGNAKAKNDITLWVK